MAKRGKKFGPSVVGSFWQNKNGRVKEASTWKVGFKAAHFDKNLADTAVEFIETCCRHVKGEMGGQPLILEWWFKQIVRAIFGWLRPDNTRLYREVYIEVPRKNAKSTYGAAIACKLLFTETEPGAEIYSCAADTDQANIVFSIAKGIVEQDDELSAVSEPFRRSIVYKDRAYHVLSADAPTKHGKNSHGILFDELHAQPDRELYDVMKTSTGSRRQPLLMMFTTAGFDKQSICWEVHEHAVKVLNGTVNDHGFLPIIYAADPADDWTDPKTWKKANPNYGVSIKEDYLRAEFEKAKVTPAYENTFKRLHLNIWCVVPETLITMANGSRRFASALRAGDWILSFDEKRGMLVRARVERVFDNGIHETVAVQTARGRHLECTTNHPFWIRYGRTDAPKYGWRQAGALKIGDRIGVALGHCLPRGSRRMNIEEAYFIGLMVGDGTCKTQRLTNGDRGVINWAQRFAQSKKCALRQIDQNHWDFRHETKGSLKMTPIKRILKKHRLIDKNFATKRVPDRIFKGGANVWAAFLSGYLDTDGHVSKGAIIWVSANPDLLADCQHLLSMLCVQSTLKNNGRRSRLEVHEVRSLKLLAQTLRLTHTQKSQRLRDFTELMGRDGDTSYDRFRFDRIKKISADYRETIGIEVEDTHSHITNGLITHNTEQETRWLQMAEWDACAAPPVVYDELKGRVCYAGLDLASTTDIAALVLVFPPRSDAEKFIALPFFFIPEDGLHDRVRRDGVPYDAWARDGFIEMTPGNLIDYRWIMLKLGQCRIDFDLRVLAFDRWGSQKIVTDLCDQVGFTVDPKEAQNFRKPLLVQFGQGFASMSPPTKELLNLVLARKISHGGNPVLRWMAQNMIVKQDPAGNIKPDKGKSTEKIDGMVALVMGLAPALEHANNPGPSIYEDRGLRTL